MDAFDLILSIFIVLVALIISAVGREIMSGLMAVRYGDETPRLNGRITLNPLKHIDILGSIIMPLTLLLLGAPFLFGYAKPMPVDFSNIAKASGYKGCLKVALAGTFFNFFMAFLCVLILKIALMFGILTQGNPISQFIFTLFYTNIVLAIFNLLPLPPLDGAKILAYLGLIFNISIFAKWYNNLEKYGMILLLLVVLLPPTQSFIASSIKFISILFLQI
ncbi:site-2 protease family protein [Helicobacter saguini]|uniref:Site-2 protease family protein n=1 Tax=Helicobacter saguini TaxID=1548018 RepID=A0A347VPC1_9HELI|nr:site-2 protease family protein [Helicobacter saguini]MWV61426.1 site-2 protease family protein [Helicobacter saguini]MWV67904.1 site-2 protease family protein [Helicobacter saguini]MWV70628.1 site-2 protease family protein [Helicobacter saguini]MWV72532.1 site-2 protease family protein [Helicobacter saguini]TLD94729.1 site-2 protease family protein [Helicobacter saguini]